MGWGTEFKAEIYLNRQKYNSILEIDDKIEEYEELIEMHKEELLISVALNPEKVREENDASLIHSIRHHVNDILESLEEVYVELYKLELLKENFGKETTDE